MTIASALLSRLASRKGVQDTADGGAMRGYDRSQSNQTTTIMCFFVKRNIWAIITSNVSGSWMVRKGSPYGASWSSRQLCSCPVSVVGIIPYLLISPEVAFWLKHRPWNFAVFKKLLHLYFAKATCFINDHTQNNASWADVFHPTTDWRCRCLPATREGRWMKHWNVEIDSFRFNFQLRTPKIIAGFPRDHPTHSSPQRVPDISQ